MSAIDTGYLCTVILRLNIMKNYSDYIVGFLNATSSSFRRVAIALLCVIVLFANGAPAYAFGSKTSSDPSDGVVQLDDVLDNARDSIYNDSIGMKDVQKKSSKGLNGVQGAADADKMKKPSDSSEVTTVKDDIENVLESIMDD